MRLRLCQVFCKRCFGHNPQCRSVIAGDIEVGCKDAGRSMDDDKSVNVRNVGFLRSLLLVTNHCYHKEANLSHHVQNMDADQFCFAENYEDMNFSGAP